MNTKLFDSKLKEIQVGTVSAQPQEVAVGDNVTMQMYDSYDPTDPPAMKAFEIVKSEDKENE